MKQNAGLIIFVGEDNLLYQQLIAKQLSSISSFIHFFESGESFLMKVQEQVPDLIVLDYNLDGVMTGLDTLKAVRAIVPGVYAVVFSNHTDLETQENFDRFGQFDYVEKNESGFLFLKEKICASLMI